MSYDLVDRDTDTAPDYVDHEAVSAPPLEGDPDAPYGRRPDGRPYRMSAEQRAEMGARLAEARAAAASSGRSTRRSKTRSRRPPAPPRRSPDGAPPPPASSGRPAAAPEPDYRLAVLGLLQIPAMGLAMLGRHDPAFQLDAATLALHGPTLAEAVHQTAVGDARLASILDRVLAVGPYGALLAATLPIALQIAANHGAIKPQPDMGVYTAEELLTELARRGARG